MHIEIIAELAQGFEGRPEQSRLLMKAAAAAGADAAKFQLVYADELATPDYKHYELFRNLEMSDEVWADLAQLARDLGIKLYVDVFGVRSLALAERIGVTTVKLHGTDISNMGFLDQVAKSAVKRVLLGAGGAHAGELERAVKVLTAKELIVLLGFQGYPTPTDTNHIARIGVVQARLRDLHADAIVGFADHANTDSSLRYALAATAIGAGARVIEKHLTLGRNMKLEDHESALNPDEFAKFCVTVRACSEALGIVVQQDDYGMSETEQDYRRTIRRHIVTRCDLDKGARLTPAVLMLKRTSSKDVVTDLELAYGKTLARALGTNLPLASRDLT